MSVDLDLVKELRYKGLVEKAGVTFFVAIEYERLPYFYNFCSCISHSLENCKKRNVQNQDKKKSKSKEELKKVYVEKQKGPCIEVVDLSSKKLIGHLTGEPSGVVKQLITHIQDTEVLDSSSNSYSKFFDDTHQDDRVLETQMDLVSWFKNF